ncbi:hypothetical protein HDV05_003336 [Chytridiales sp. JEL 0842]|nr:hypothetical protein HDV05_003336 [Chytridiales sp. JEL 0842]
MAKLAAAMDEIRDFERMIKSELPPLPPKIKTRFSSDVEDQTAYSEHSHQPFTVEDIEADANAVLELVNAYQNEPTTPPEPATVSPVLRTSNPKSTEFPALEGGESWGGRKVPVKLSSSAPNLIENQQRGQDPDEISPTTISTYQSAAPFIASSPRKPSVASFTSSARSTDEDSLQNYLSPETHTHHHFNDLIQETEEEMIPIPVSKDEDYEPLQFPRHEIAKPPQMRPAVRGLSPRAARMPTGSTILESSAGPSKPWKGKESGSGSKFGLMGAWKSLSKRGSGEGWSCS